MHPPPPFLIEPILRMALHEDFGRAGDLTTDRIVPQGACAVGAMVARKAGVIAGLGVAEQAFQLLDPSLTFEPVIHDGEAVEPGAILATVSGNACAILSAERVALNLLCHMSGIATETAWLVALIPSHTKARLTCTRKTTPGLRALEKYAVTCGGGFNHRFGLDDAILIKDNHIAIAGGIPQALSRAKDGLGHLVKVEVEVDTLAQLQQALDCGGADCILLDNMEPDMLRQAVAMIGGRALAEASGGITAETIAAVAETGVDLIAVGWITHSAPILDIGLDFRKAE